VATTDVHPPVTCFVFSNYSVYFQHIKLLLIALAYDPSKLTGSVESVPDIDYCITFLTSAPVLGAQHSIVDLYVFIATRVGNARIEF
jgi:hypothetical protein